MFGGPGRNYISQAQAKEMMNGDVIILDVREDYEFELGHIENAVTLPLGMLQNDIAKVTTEKDKTLLVYCLSGARSASAVRLLHSMGYKNAYNMGGISSWEYGIVR